MSFRIGLVEPHLWSAIKALEKYLRAILIYNGRHKRTLSHNLLHIVREVEGIPDINMRLGDREREFLARLSSFCDGRGVTKQDHRLPSSPLELDHTVWSIRRYCMYLRGFQMTRKGKQIDLLDVNLKNIRSEYYLEHPFEFKIAGGFLEQVLEKSPSDQLRKSLVWKNRYYGTDSDQGLKRFFLASHRRSGTEPAGRLRRSSRPGGRHFGLPEQK
ncbi:MAG: hypothetical protein R3231_10485 [bacterium]|nr:hypothetical protein [bacterium]